MIGVTGANGLLGSFIIRKLVDEKARFVAFKRKASDISLLADIEGFIEWREMDLLDPVSMEAALQETSDRLGTPEFQFFVITLAIQRETGGNLAETLGNLADVLRKRAQMKLKIRAMSSESKASAYIVGSLPFIVRKCVTARMLTFEIGPLTLAVSEDVPSLAGATFPSTLSVLNDRSLLTFLNGDGGWDANQDSVTGSAARDWSRLRDRMAYIVKLFRCYHLHESVHAPPYSDPQVVAIESGSIPEGRL